MRYLLLLTVILIGCQQRVAYRAADADALIRPYVEDFVTLYGTEITEVIYEFRQLEDRAAQCLQTDGLQVVSVDPDVWETICPAQKRALVFHELGHCVLGRSHTDPEVLSYMYARLLSCEWYEEHQEAMDVELFDPDLGQQVPTSLLTPMHSELQSPHVHCSEGDTYEEGLY